MNSSSTSAHGATLNFDFKLSNSANDHGSGWRGYGARQFSRQYRFSTYEIQTHCGDVSQLSIFSMIALDS